MGKTKPSGSRHRPQTLEDDLQGVLARTRSAFAELLTSVGANPTQPQDIARQFSLNKNLTWKISRIIRETEPAAAIPYMPGKAGLTIFLDTMKKAGASIPALTQARQALDDFDRLIRTHAGDRETLELMLGSMTGDSDGQQSEAQRKLSFRGNSSIWGVQARVQVCVNFIAPSRNPDWVDLAWLSGLVDFRRLRREAVWAIASTRKIEDDGSPMPLGKIESLDPAHGGEGQAPLLGEFCSDPLPKIRTNTGADGLMRYELLEGPIGKTAAATCLIGIHGREFIRRISAPNDTIGEHGARLYTPAELLIHDLFVHRDLEYAMSPEIHLYSQLPSVPSYPACGREHGLLPVTEKVLRLGGSPPDVLTPELPRYPAMIQAVFDRVGWKANEFYGFRFRMRFPPIPTLAILRYPLAKR